MLKRFLVISLFLTTGTNVYAGNPYVLNFDLLSNDKLLYRGEINVSNKPHTWSKGLQRSYLRLSCHQQESGKVEKLYSTVDHFSGFRVTHQLVEKSVEITATHSTIQPRLAEIRALPKGQCMDLSPIVTTTTEVYSLPAKETVNESLSFGKNMRFKVKLQRLN
ncbi:MAG: hypothetical protein P1U80_03715 [Pseudomonadales bacterium]|jgi:hypothetical protein|nr:hypothetical protein [Pseudomonadales bacterium]